MGISESYDFGDTIAVSREFVRQPTQVIVGLGLHIDHGHGTIDYREAVRPCRPDTNVALRQTTHQEVDIPDRPGSMNS